MGRFRVEYARKVEKQLGTLDRQIAVRVVEAIDSLADNPRPAGCKAMQGQQAYRIRVADKYRVIYEIHDDAVLVLILKVGHRREVYDR